MVIDQAATAEIKNLRKGKDMTEYLRKLEDVPGFSNIPLPGHSTTRAINKILIDPVTGSKNMMLLWAKHEPGSISQTHTHSVDQAYYVLSGILKVNIDGKESIVKPNSSVFFPAGVKHGLEAMGNEPTTFLIIFAPPVDTFTDRPH